ncbi:MAG TPA: TIGR03085 family metal-binding protein [Streptosporangiaceae bacterium]
MTYSRDERRALCAALDEAGPDAPTLCDGWATRDLAAHLVLREHRPDAAAGMLGGPLAKHTQRVQQGIAGRTPYPRLVQTVRDGPPRLSLFGLPGVDARANLVEYFVHHEDVRRGAPGWEPRELDSGLTEMLWSRLGMTRLILRRVPVGIEFARDDVPDGDGDGDGAGSSARRHRMTIKTATPVVTVIGPPAELTLWAMGRTGAARVRLDGTESAIQKVTSANWRL